jgi:hypothetical protein
VALSLFKYKSEENRGEKDFGEKILDEGRLFENQRRKKKQRDIIERRTRLKKEEITEEVKDKEDGGIDTTLLGSFRGEK